MAEPRDVRGRFVAALVAAVIGIAGVALVVLAFRDATSTPDRGGTPASGDAVVEEKNQDAPTVAEVTCDKDEVSVASPVVRASHDGLRLVFLDAGDSFGAVQLHHETWEEGTAENVRLHGRVTEATSSIAPGKVTIVCLRGRHGSYDDPGVASATITLVDPDEFYVPWDLACGFGEQFRASVWAGEEGDPEEVFRRVPGIEATDEFKPPKYPGSPQYSSIDRMVIRGGSVVARLMGPGIGPTWDLLINACPDSGIVPD